MSAHNQNWHVQVKEEDQNFTNTCIEQIEDPLKAIMVKKFLKKTSFIWNVAMAPWKPKCQTVWHTWVQGPTNCPIHCFHPNCGRVKRFWVTITIYMEILNTEVLPKLPKWALFIWKAIIVFTVWGGWGWGVGMKAGRCLNTAVTLCGWVC